MMSVCLAAALLMADGDWPAGVGEPFKALVRSERSFAAAARERGSKAAFLEYLGAEGIVFRPGPVNARQWLADRPDTADILAWEPQLADVSADGKMGYTTGPWSYQPSKDEPPIAHGHYLSVWRQQADGNWLVAIDTGISHPDPAPAKPLAAALPAADPYRSPEPGPENHLASLLDADRSLAVQSARDRPAAWSQRAAGALRVYRPGRFPITERAASLDVIGQESTVDEVAGGDAAASGDFGYTYGARRASPGEPPVSYYTRIWQRDASGTWRVAVDLESPAGG